MIFFSGEKKPEKKFHFKSFQKKKNWKMEKFCRKNQDSEKAEFLQWTEKNMRIYMARIRVENLFDS